MTGQLGVEPSSLEGLRKWAWEASDGGATKNLAAWRLEKVGKGHTSTTYQLGRLQKARKKDTLVGQQLALIEPKVPNRSFETLNRDMTGQPGVEPSSLEGLRTRAWEASEGGAPKNLAAWTLEEAGKGRSTTKQRKGLPNGSFETLIETWPGSWE